MREIAVDFVYSLKTKRRFNGHAQCTVIQNVRRYFSVVALTIIGMAAVYFHGRRDL